MASRIHGFAPLVGDSPRLLILGSMPSVASLEKQQYYGKPQNAFWHIMGELFGAGPELPYEQRTLVLTDAGIAVWDVLASCVRPGSLDSAIEMRTAALNDFPAFFAAHPTLTRVVFNGRKSEEVFRKRAQASVSESRPNINDIDYVCLPSTSPAMASLSFAEKLASWRIVSHV